MKVYQQVSQHDCGISITQSLINYYFNQEVAKEILFEKCSPSKFGISIFDLENLNAQYGIKLDPYEMNYQEFLDYKISDYFILILNRNNISHYVIAKKHKNYVVIYDSAIGKHKLNYIKLKEQFCNVVIFISINKEKKIVFDQILQKKQYIEWEKVVIIFVIDFLVVGLNIVNGYFIKSIFNNVIYSNSIGNLGIILFIAFFGNFTLAIGQYWTSIYITKYRDIYVSRLTNYLLNNIQNKNNNFFQKITSMQLLMIQQHISNIAQYYTQYFNLWIINILKFLVFFFWLAMMHYYFAIIVLTSIFARTAYSWFCYKYNKKYIGKTLELQNEQKKLFFIMEDFLKNESNASKLKDLCFKIKENVQKDIAFSQRINFNFITIEKLNSLINSLIQLSLYLIGAYFLIKNQMPLGTLIIATTFYSYVNQSFSEIVNYFFFKISFQASLSIFNLLIDCDNIKKDGLNWQLLKNIECKNLTFFHGDQRIFKKLNVNLTKNTFIYGPSGSGKSTFYRILTNKLSITEGQMLFNNIEQKNLQQKQFNDHVIYLNSKSSPLNWNWNNLFQNISQESKDNIIVIAKLLNLEIKNEIIPESYSSGQCQFINLVFLLLERNKLICLDEATAHINDENKKIIFEKIISLIQKNNFVLCSEHDLSVQKYFEKKINLIQLKNEKCYS